MQVIERCLALSQLSEDSDRLTRTFLSPPMREVHRLLREWTEAVGMTVSIDAAGNLRAIYPGDTPECPRILIGSHVDTVPGSGSYDGIIGVMLAIELVERLRGRRLRFGIEVVAFSEEEGVRFSLPFIGSRALVGSIDAAVFATQDRNGISIEQAIRNFDLDPAALPHAMIDPNVTLGYLEFHIEQGPVLEHENLSIGVVSAIAGQSRYELTFTGQANHAGTTPMRLRHDALAAAAEWIVFVEQTGKRTEGLVATVGRIDASPGAGNVIAGEVHATLDVRHADDATRRKALRSILAAARRSTSKRGVTVAATQRLDQTAVQCDPEWVSLLEQASESAGYRAPRLVSGAGHDAMILAQRVPAAMLFLRSPGGISHHRDEAVRAEDVEAAIATGENFLKLLELRIG